jgi:hypothetical protein
MQARHLVYKLIPPAWQYEQACSVCKVLFNHAIYGIYEGFHTVVLDFIWVVNVILPYSANPRDGNKHTVIHSQ